MPKFAGKITKYQQRYDRYYMSRKRKELPLIEGVEITGVAAEGNALAKVDEMVVFIPFGAPGDVADVKLDKKKKNYAEGHIEKLIRHTIIEA